jgi:hypothetical protein
MKKGTTAWYFYGVDPRQNEIKRYALDFMHDRQNELNMKHNSMCYHMALLFVPLLTNINGLVEF